MARQEGQVPPQALDKPISVTVKGQSNQHGKGETAKNIGSIETAVKGVLKNRKKQEPSKEDYLKMAESSSALEDLLS